MRLQAQKGRGIFIGIPQHQKGYFVHVPITRKIISSYDVVFDEFFSSMLAYTSQKKSKAMAMFLSVSYITSATSSKGKNGNIITFAQFEEGVYYLKLIKMQKVMTKAVKNLMMIQLFHHYLT